MAREYDHTVTLALSELEVGEYSVVAGEKRVGFTLSADYKQTYIEAVDVVLRETSPVQIVTYIAYGQGCDSVLFTRISQRREGDAFFVSIMGQPASA